jgi:hypothetical protein
MSKSPARTPAVPPVRGATSRPAVFTKARRDAFLTKLSETANVSASARVARVTTGAVYRERRKCAAFRAAWAEALCEGYVRLESEILAEALRRPSVRTPDAVLRARTAKMRLAMALLTLHRAAVRGERREAPAQAPAPVRSPADIRARLEARFAEMRRRMADDDD